MATAFIQEFTIVDGDTSTTNYDAVTAKLDLQGAAPQGLLLHSAGFDHDAGVFRIFDVWETRADGERFITEKLEPAVEEPAPLRLSAATTAHRPSTRVGTSLHDSMAGSAAQCR